MSTKKDNLETLFSELHGSFDLETPQEGHQERFLEKLNRHNHADKVENSPKPRRFNLVLLSVAASLALILSIGYGIFSKHDNDSGKSLEVQKTEFYFASLLQEEMEKIQAEASPETKNIIDDAMAQMDKLELDYSKLESELKNSGNSKPILHAMITNFQTRINLLQDVLEQIEEIKKLKNEENETHII
ncbi:hypothetical protein [Robertkochia solimangrovi]|uniref:hypothetical protein n=1 Tax=Robertkochia solimangrovi TaxID=2213046 RepID=UPI00117D90E1|nr:hypothetical protein [Robertkochia solimangrovi]TRZ43483.1 hypothetical protein DMZ48_08625 [Robertkochia solimangrovi]